MTAPAIQDVRCPKCQGPTWYEVGGKFWGNGLTSNGKQKPTHKCKDKACGGAVWAKDTGTHAPRQAAAAPKGPQPVSIGLTGNALLDEQTATEDKTFAELQAGEEWITLKRRYLETLDFVTGPVLRKLTESDVGASPESVASITAAVWIERNKRGV